MMARHWGEMVREGSIVGRSQSALKYVPEAYDSHGSSESFSPTTYFFPGIL
jgi:hypothetical protein